MPFWVFAGFDVRLPALIDQGGGVISYAELDSQAEVWRQRLEALVAQGLVAGPRPMVALAFETSPEAIAAYLGVLRSGFPLLLLEPGKPDAQEAMLKVYHPDIMLTRDAAGFDLRPAKPGAGAGDVFPAPHPDLRLLLSTSGTTGDPKLVRLSAQNIASNASAIAEYLRVTPADRAITTLPLYYSYGMSVLNSYLAAGATLVLNEHSVTEPAFRTSFVRTGASSMALVPHQFDLLMHSGFTGAELPGLRYITQAGGRLDTETTRSFAAMGTENGWALVVMYGQTEAAPRIAYVPPEALPQAAGTIGRAIPGGRLWIADDAGTEITAPGVAGELIYAGPNVMMGYAISRADFAHGAEVDALHTGDVAERTEDGLFRIVGRLKRFVKLFGLRLSLDQIETLLQSRGIRAQAVAVDDSLVLLLREIDQAEAARSCLAEAFGLPASAVHAGALDEMPLLASGKTDHRALSRIAASVLQAEIARSSHEAAIDLGEVLRRATRSPTVGPLDSFTSLGGDSLSYIEVQMHLEERFGRAPQGWENMTLAELNAIEAAGAKPGAADAGGTGWRRVGIDVILRVVAITLIVAQHASNYPLYGGTWMLIVVMGYSAARFQHRQIAEGNALKLGFNLLYPILPLYFLLLAAYQLFRDHILLMDVLLLGNYHLGNLHSLLQVYWFVSLYAQIVLLMMIVTAIPALREGLMRSPWKVAFGAAAVLQLAVVAIILMTDMTEPGERNLLFPVPHRANHSLIVCLPLFLTGWAIHFGRTRWAMLCSFGLAVTASAMLVYFATPVTVVPLLLVTVLLLAARVEVTLPAGIARLIQRLAAATLFVYLGHEIIVTFLIWSHWSDPVSVAIAVPTSFLMGVLGKAVFDRFDAAMRRYLNGMRATAPGFAPEGRGSSPQ